MKNIFKIVLISMLCLINWQSFAQDQILDADGNILDQDQAALANQEKTEEERCFCYTQQDLWDFSNYVFGQSNQQLAFQRQQAAIKREIERRLGKQYSNFGQAQREFFKALGESAFRQGNFGTHIQNYIKNEFEYDLPKIRQAEIRYDVVDMWKEEYQDRIIRNRPRKYKFGDILYKGKRLEDIRDRNQNNSNSNFERNTYNQEADKYRTNKNWEKKYDKAIQNKAYSLWIADQFKRAYDQSGSYANAINLMSAYMVIDFRNYPPPLQTPNQFLPQGLFYPASEHNGQMIDITRRQGVSNTPAPSLNLSPDESIFRYAIQTFGNAEANFINRDQVLKNNVRYYLKKHEYKGTSLGLARTAVRKFRTNEPTYSNVTQYIDHGKGGFYYSFDPNQKLAFRAYISNFGMSQGYEGISRIYHMLSSQYSESRYKVEGSFMRKIFRAVNRNQYYRNMSDENLGLIFNFNYYNETPEQNDFFLEYNRIYRPFAQGLLVGYLKDHEINTLLNFIKEDNYSEDAITAATVAMRAMRRHQEGRAFDQEFYNSLNPYFDANTTDPFFGIRFMARCAALSKEHPDWAWYKIVYEASKNGLHLTLDAIGLIPVGGEVADLINGALYLMEGDLTNASLSAASAVPFAGWAATGAKLVGKVVVTAAGTKVIIILAEGSAQINKLVTRLIKFKEEISTAIDAIKDGARYVLEGTGKYKNVSGHHPLAKKAFEGDAAYQFREAFSVSNKKLDEISGIEDVHFQITGNQNSLYSAWKRANPSKTMTLEDMAKIEVKAMVEEGIPEDVAKGWVIKALQDLDIQGVSEIKNIPWNGVNPN